MAARTYLYLGAVVAATLALFLFRLWQPEQQVDKHSAHLLDAVAQQNWSKFATFIADDYRDQWGNDRAAVLQRTREVFRYLRAVKITRIDATTRLEPRQGYWSAKISIEGKDGDNDLLVAVKERVNTLKTPFEFEWHRISGKPWDWKLVAVRNPDLVVPSEY